MNIARLLSVLSVVGLIASVPGCAGAEHDDATVTEEGALGSSARARAQTSDEAIKAKLADILRDVTFMSESDYPYTVIEADGGGAKRLSLKVVRTKLREVVKAKTSSNRDISKADCRAQTLSIADAMSDAASTDPEERNAKQASLAVKYMTEQLKGVVGYTFGTNASGDEDDVGPVVYVYVGISRASGKLIAILTEAVYT